MRRAGTGTVERRGAVYVARLPNARRTVIGRYPSAAEAHAVLDAAVYLNQRGQVDHGRTLADYGRRVLDRRELDGYRSTDRDRSRWRSYVETWTCGAWPIASVRKSDVKAWVLELRRRGLAHQTISNALNLLRAVYRAAEDDELVEVNPCAGVEVRSHGRTDETSTYLTLDELAALIYSADDEGAHLIAIAAVTGLRQGELRSMLASDVHLDVERPHLVVRHGSPGAATKSGRIRRVPLFGLGLAAMRSWRSPRNDRGLAFATKGGAVRCQGRIVEPKAWRSWLARAGITRRVRWHDLRHTCATLLLTGDLGARPWSLEEVRELLGHSTIAVTERYAAATGTLAERAAHERHESATEPQDRRSGLSAKAAEALAESESRLRDLNSRPTVYETPINVSDPAQLRAWRGAIVGALRCIADGRARATIAEVDELVAALDEIDARMVGEVAA